MNYFISRNKFILSSVFYVCLIFILFSFYQTKAADYGQLIKTSQISSVYYLDSDNLRHAFPSESVYFSWYDNFDVVKTITSTELQSYQLGANVTMRPGTKLIKITTDPSVYAVEPGGVLRKIPSESEAKSIYGSNWSTKVVDVSDAFFTNYTLGAPIASSTPPAGTLVKSSDTKYFYFDGSQYRPITSAESFHANRFKSENIINLNKTISSSSIGLNISSTENSLSDIHTMSLTSGIALNHSTTTSTTLNTPGAISYSGGGGGGGSSSSGGGGTSGAPITSPVTNPVVSPAPVIIATSSTSTIVVTPATTTVPIVPATTTTPIISNYYYISPNGSDTTGTGSANAPWASLYKACNSVTTSGSTIHINAGTYIENLECVLSPGVSIEGEGQANTIIKSHYTTPNTLTMNSAAISLVSSASGTTNGSQSISNIRLDGDNLQGSGGILIKKRSNVKVHDITIVDFFKNGIAFWGPSAFNTGNGPFLYDDGNELYNSIITNCGDIPGDNVTFSGGGLILMTAQSNLLIHDNILTENSRAQGHNGNIINAGGRHFTGVKYYNNKSYKPDNEGPDLSNHYTNGQPTGWNFHLEIWHTEGGFEIYNNEFHGGSCAVDIGGEYAKKGKYAYSYSIHDNLFTPISGHGGTQSYHGSDAITVEAFYTEDVYIYNNHFLNFPITIEIGDEPSHFCEMKRIYVYNNLMENTGYGNGIFTSVMTLQVKKVGNITSDIYMHNNTIVSDPSSRTMALAVQIGNAGIPGGGTLNNLNVKNNILVNHTNASPIYITNNGAINGLHIENNLAYNLNNYNVAPYFRPNNTGTLSNYTYLNNIPSSNTTQQNPLFISSSDYHLQSSSPAVNKGIDVGLPYNGAAPDMGTFEY